MPESEQDQESEESTPEGASRSGERQDMEEKPAGFRAAEPATERDVEILEDSARSESSEQAEAGDVEVSRESGDDADAVMDAPADAKPGHKNDPDMKDMGVGPRPIDDQSAE